MSNHIEFTLAQLQARRAGKAALKRGFEPANSELWLDYAGQRPYQAQGAFFAALLQGLAVSPRAGGVVKAGLGI